MKSKEFLEYIKEHYEINYCYFDDIYFINRTELVAELIEHLYIRYERSISQ